MILEQLVLESLGHASYLVASEQTGNALVLDPRRDVEIYLDAARRLGVRIAFVLDTHQHNDYVSGILELAARTGARVLASGHGDVMYPHEPVQDGQQIALGDVILDVLHTPGHTPEHLSLLGHEGAQEEAALLLSGGALLVGDIARPDLLGGPDEKREAARMFCRTLQEKILTLPDHLLVYPTHVAGSLCGGNIGSRFTTSVGYERRTNPVLAAVAASDVFVDECLRMDDLPAVPPYWRRMRALNLRGPDVLGALAEPPALAVDEFAERMHDGAVVLDARAPESFAGAHIPGALNAGIGNSFPTWAGTIVSPDHGILLVLDRADDLREATWGLLRTGYPPPLGWLAGGMQSWRTSGHAVELTEQITVHDLVRRRDEFDILDVRQPNEWHQGHIEDAIWITGAEVPQRLDDVPRGDRPLAIVCGSGYRSSAIASLLTRHGRRDVVNVVGGMGAWNAAKLATLKEE